MRIAELGPADPSLTELLQEPVAGQPVIDITDRSTNGSRAEGHGGEATETRTGPGRVMRHIDPGAGRIGS